MSSAKHTNAGVRDGAEFFLAPDTVAQRRYETLRAYFVDGATAAEAAARFGYAESTVAAMVRDHRAGKEAFFIDRRPGPSVAPAKDAARERVLELRRGGATITDIEARLADSDTPLNRTGIWQLCRDAGMGRLPTVSPGPVASPTRDHPPRVAPMVWPEEPVTIDSDHAGMLLLLPGLVELDVAGAIDAAGMPSTRQLSAANYVLSLLALKLAGQRRVSHVEHVAADPALAAIAGLSVLPKATALGSYSWRTDRARSQALLAAVASGMLTTGQAQGHDIDLDFHAIMHFGEDVALEAHYVPRRSQRTRSVLTFFAQDHDTDNLIYANADIHKTDQADEVIAFVDHWQQATGHPPGLLVFDSKVTNGTQLGQLADRGIRFITLRSRHPSILTRLDALDDDDWTTITLNRKGPHRRPQIHTDTVTVSGCDHPLRQIAVRGLGRDKPTLVLANDHTSDPAWIVDRYAKRATIEQRLGEAIAAFHLDSLSSSIALNVDLDTTLTVIAAAAYDHLRRRLSGYHTAVPATIRRDFTSTRGALDITADGITVRLNNRTRSPIMRTATIPEIAVPWWGGRYLRFDFDNPPR